MLDNAQSANLSLINFAPVPVNEIDSSIDDDGHDTPFDEFTGRQAYRLYVSHSLSMWNSRMYEFGVVRHLHLSLISAKLRSLKRVIRIIDSLHTSRIS